MPFKSEAQRKFLNKTNPDLAEKFEKIHNSPSYKRMKARRGKRMNGPGGFVAAAQRRLDMGKSVPPGLRRVKQMASGRFVPMPTGTRRAQPMPSVESEVPTRKAQPFGPGSKISKMPAFQAAARRRMSK